MVRARVVEGGLKVTRVIASVGEGVRDVVAGGMVLVARE